MVGLRHPITVEAGSTTFTGTILQPQGLEVGIAETVQRGKPSWDAEDRQRVTSALLTLLSGWEWEPRSACVEGVSVSVGPAWEDQG